MPYAATDADHEATVSHIEEQTDASESDVVENLGSSESPNLYCHSCKMMKGNAMTFSTWKRRAKRSFHASAIKEESETG